MHLASSDSPHSEVALSRRLEAFRLPVPGHVSALCRALDVVLALLLLIFLGPVMAGTSLLIKLQDGGPVLFGHQRIGRDGRLFQCLKFRSMVVGAEHKLTALLDSDPIARAEWNATQKLRADPRVTAFGRCLRMSSLDEFPQLFNVLRGDMSLVGPRPIVLNEARRYGRYFHHYCAVRPGLTGLWQVSGRSDTTYRKRVAFDVLYARSQSVSLYLRVLTATIPAVFGRIGSY